MDIISAPRPIQCTTCGMPGNTPQIRTRRTAVKIVTEAHYICRRCSSRFRVGILKEETIQDEKQTG
jgi:ribosomal protein L37E